MDTLKWTGRKQLPLTRQTESAECGLACLGNPPEKPVHE